MKKYIFDVEVYPNYFEVGFKEFNTSNILFFELNHNTNDLQALIQFLNTKHILISFNGIHYDNLILNWIIKNKYLLDDQKVSVLEFLANLKDFSDSIIKDKYDIIKPYKNKLFNSIDVDLYLYWSKMLRLSKKISLKGLAVQLNIPLIQELPYEPSDILSDEAMKQIKLYNVNDLNITEELCRRMENDDGSGFLQATGSIKLRFDIANERGFECHSWDAIKLASEELLHSYHKQTNISKYKIRNFTFNRPIIRIKDVLSDIKFNFKTKIFNNLLDNLNNSVDKFSETILFTCKKTNILLSYGIGGLNMWPLYKKL